MPHIPNGSKKTTQFEEDLLKFPPILRKIALQMIKSDRILNVSQAAREAGLSPKSVKVATYRERKKGNNFDELTNRIAYQKLTFQKPIAYDKLMDGIQKGSHKHLELYFRLVGDLREPRNGPDTVNNNLVFVLPMPESIEPPKTIDTDLIRDAEKEETE